MDSQHTHARELIQVFRRLIQNGDPVIHGYPAAAVAIGLNGENYARHLGQVCSRIDAASFIAGYPMLALHMVRKQDGSLNPDSFGPAWIAWADEIKSRAESRAWTEAQVDEFLRFLDGLPASGAYTIWSHYLNREFEKPGFIRYNLHRKVGGALTS